jgi:SAM-dependent methyltransferase
MPTESDCAAIAMSSCDGLSLLVILHEALTTSRPGLSHRVTYLLNRTTMHLNSQLLFEKYARHRFDRGMRVLEIGPDGFPSVYKRMVGDLGLTWETVDIYDSPQLTYSKSEPYSFPVHSDSYDIVLSGQVIEHVAKIWRWMPEVARVTKPGGLVITINPTSWPYHPAPIDCWRIFPDGMKALCEDAGLVVETSFSGSLELATMRRSIPGRSPDSQHRLVRLAYRVLGQFGFPVEKAFDTITIARKR